MKQTSARSLTLLFLCAVLGLAPSAAASTDTLVPVGATWKYLDDGSDQGTDWSGPGFDDSAWASGPAQLGYGDGDEATLISYGPNPDNKYVTSYFRRSFNVANAGAYAAGLLRVRRDDGVILYLNGVEIFRDGFSEPEVNFTTLAVNAGDDGTEFLTTTYPVSLLVNGPNLIAAEVHQSGPSSSDVSFDLELIASDGAPGAVLVSPGPGSTFTTPATIPMVANVEDLDGVVTKVEFFQGGTKVGEAVERPFAFDWTGVGAGSYALRAIAIDDGGLRGTSAVVTVNVLLGSVPTIANRLPTPGDITGLSNITVVFSERVSGVDAADLLVNGVPATSVTGSGSNYQFTVARPAEGSIYVAWKGGHGIGDLESPPKPFDSYGAGATWQYTLTDTVAPAVLASSPMAGATLNQLDQIVVRFTEPVGGVNASDLLVNGVAATRMSGAGAGPYEFACGQPPNGTVNVSWATDHGIRDLATARNAFTGAGWNYTLNTNAVWDGQVIISEIMFHPMSGRVADEWIEIRNVGVTNVNLSGWHLNRAVEFDFPNIILAAGQHLVIAADGAAFRAKYPAVTNVVGGWIGRLSNLRDEVEIEDASGQQVDLVEYADQGDWAVRVSGAGWDWTNPADGSGRSMELRQPALPNDSGQNWLASRVLDGTPGGTNSVATNNLPPLILNVTHLPAVPRSTNAITFLARIVDESASGLTVRVRYRDASANPLGAFNSLVMLDNGQSNDGVAGDGVYGTVLAAKAAGFIGEYYLEASDASGRIRTWPAAADLGSGTFAQEANAFFQVDDEVYSGRQPIYRLIMRAEDRSALFNNFDLEKRNATFIAIEGSDVQVRHNCATRRRGASSFGSTPPTMKFEIPRDRLWNNKSSLNLNSVNTYAQVLGAAIALKSGLPAPYTTAVQVRFNGVNQSTAGGMFGSYAAVEVANDEWARDHFPDDANGNVYSKRRPELFFEYSGTNAQVYIDYGYDKESNASDNDWTDLMNLMFALDPEFTPANLYVQAARKNVNVDLWLRYFSVLFLLNYTETALSNGADDDYDTYRGIIDPRFMILPHDFDSIFGSDGGNSTANNLFDAARIPNVGRFLHHPEFEPLFYAEYRRQLAGIFSTNNLFPLMDQLLGDWVPGSTIQGMKNNALGRINFVQGAVPAAPVVVRASVSGEPDSPTFQTTATLTVGGAGLTHYRYHLNGGAWSADQLISQTINLSGLTNSHYTVFVIGRNSSGTWQPEASVTVSKTWAVLSSLRGVMINEVLARNDSAVAHEGTYPDIVELANPPGGASIDLSGYRLTDDLNNPNMFIFPAGTTLAAGAYRVFYGNNPDGTSGIHIGFGLSQDGDTLYLLDRATNGLRVIDSVSFGWQLANQSIGRLPNGQWGLCAPSPDSANTAVSLGSTASLKINEWLASPASPFVDDFIEIYNPDSLPVSLGGLFLTDTPIGQPLRHPIAPLSFVDGFGYRALIGDGDSSAGPNHLDFSLSSTGGEIGLFSASGTAIDSVIYSTQFAGVSQGRNPNGGTRIVYLEAPTPGAGNPVVPGPVEPVAVSLVPLNSTFLWRYNDTGADLGTSWTAASYDDSAWPSGPGVLGFDNNLPFLEPLRTTLAVANPKVTYYFRARFSAPAGLAVSSLRATHLTDDGAVYYLNGVEIGRFFLPPAPAVITSSTLATSHEATAFETTLLNPAPLVAGENLIAVEVHQNQPNSADLVFGLRLDALVVTNNPVDAGLKINEVLANARNSTNSDGTITDWVELYNPSNGAIDLTGLSLTDQLTTPRRWVFPPGSTITARSYRVIRFDPNTPASTNFSALLNTGFGLKISGDSLHLFNRPQGGGELLDSISFGIQAPDFSVGRVPSGGTNWVLTLPTPGAVNLASALGNRAQLKINEWMAAPTGGADWFELSNPSAQPVDLSGLHLTDDLNDRLKYPPLPARSYIAMGLSGFIQFIADGDE